MHKKLLEWWRSVRVTALRYGWTLLLCAGATLLQLATAPWMVGPPLPWFMTAIALCGALWGTGPAIAAIVLNAVQLHVVLAAEGYHPLSVPYLVRTASLLVASGVGLALYERLQRHDERTRREAGEAHARLAAATEAREQWRDEVAQVVRDKHNFVSIVSHELRTPLSVVKAYAMMLTDEDFGSALGTADRETVTHILQAANRLEDVIKQVMMFSDVQLGKVELQYAPIQLPAFMHETVYRIINKARARKLKILTDTTYCPSEMVCDRAHLERVLLELITNAINFTPGTGQITVRATGDHERVVFSVLDTGVGIKATALRRVQEPFYQERDAMVREVGGMGLGLSLATALVEALGGTLDIESAEGQGSTFTVTLPKERP